MIPTSGIDYQSLFESSPGLYLILQPDFTIVAVSDSYLDATMTKREEILGRGLFDVFPDNPTDPTATGVSNLRTSLNYVLGNHIAHTMAVQKYDIRKPDGTFEERFWSPLNKPVFNAKNELAWIIHRVEDVTDFIRLKKEEAIQMELTGDLRKRVGEMEMETFKRAQEIQEINKKLIDEMIERKKAEIILQKSLKDVSDYKYALDESSIVAITDQNGIITYVNDNFCIISKFSREELIGQDHRIINSGFHTKEFISDLWATIINGKVWRNDVKNKAKDGTYFWLDTTIVPFLNEHGKPYQYVTIRSDITQRKELEGKISLLNQELQERVKEKTREVIEKEQELTEQRINQQKLITEVTIQAQEKERNELGRELHDNINQILATAKMYLGMAKGKENIPKDLIVQCHTYLIQAMEEIRKLSHSLVAPSLGDIELEEALKGLVEEINNTNKLKLQLIYKEQSKKNIDKKMELMLYRIFQEQINNILKHAHASKAAISLMKKSTHLILSISDNGLGFNVEDTGKGIGLKNISSRVKFYSGTMNIISAPSKGCTLEISIPY